MSLIKIGVAGPFTGPRAAFGDMLKQGVERARLEAGDGFEWVFGDDAGIPETGEQAAIELVKAGVRVSIGHFNSASAKLAKPHYRKASIPFLAPASTNAELTADGDGWLLRLCPHDGQQSDAVLRFVSEQGIRSLALLADETFYGQALVALFPDAWNGTSIAHVQAEDERVLTSDAVFFAGTHYNSANVLRALREQGYKGMFIGSDDSKLDEFLELAGSAGESSYVLGFEETYEETSYKAATLVWKTLKQYPEARGEELLRLLHVGSGEVAFTEQGERTGMEWSVWQERKGEFVKVE